ncbi:ATP-binding protein [Leptospira santarosai]|uniref:ATP-binding protein n=1 Tax=Leptospira TaxID=171 RepID=UPI0002927305|nr:MULTISPECIES: ATP-binding protein [Leptospira]EKO79883.1 GHKL domain protein [Leptospira sp. Fiocruz LV3954]EMI61566.1 GHKL domain protein [Leptospira sp. Fiocruz LV4135]OLY61810.1 ATP-binding protein [Leptospira santarosai serovar Guaricura]
MKNNETLKIRPYARLLTMLGEQLIKNERIALIELIKNSYDADAEWVKISFVNFDEDFKYNSNSKIVIEDSGLGMTYEIIEKHLLNPATPEKKRKKEANNNRTEKGRILQGEKGIGRFAILKLGRRVEIITKTQKDKFEYIVDYNFTKYDNDFLTENGKEKELFIDDLQVNVVRRAQQSIITKEVNIGTRKIKRPDHGTIIEISDLKGSWSLRKIEAVYSDIARLQSIFSFKNKKKKDFDVCIYKNNELINFEEKYLEKLSSLLFEQAVLKIEKGKFNDQKMEFTFNLNGVAQKISLSDPYVCGLRVFRNASKELEQRKLECGPFEFGFYIFDFSNQAPGRFKLNKADKDIIKKHRIYLYRDEIRVYPYGEPDDDWLKIDTYRGTISAGHFLSNDQVVGYVNITQAGNPSLKDKTNREGLIEEGNATADFIILLQTFLAYIRQKPYSRYRKDLENKKDQNIFRTEAVRNDIEKLKKTIKDNSEASEILSKIEDEYIAEKKYLIRRAETTEELAGVGLSVETASHDIMAIMSKVLINIDSLIKDLVSGDKIDINQLLSNLQSIRGGMGFVESQLKDIQLLFTSSKQRRRNIKVIEVLEKVVKIYERFLKKESIEFIIKSSGSPLIAKTTDAVLLQLFLNLFDNSFYWLQQVDKPGKKIEVSLNGKAGQLFFSDNGPGIDKDDIPYIFEPFYSGKGEDGRGLGLYIARQLLERNEYSIELAELKSEKLLSGANFIINFFKDSE